MIFNGDISTVANTVIYTVPSPSPGVRNSGNNASVNLLRIVNESGASRTFNLYLNVNGTPRNIVPVDTQLPIGAVFDDLPEFQLAPGSTIQADASDTGVTWTINVVLL